MRPVVDVPTLLLASLGLWGCQPDLPPCDPVAARQVAFLDAPSDVTDDDGVPMYEGQALMHLSCGAGTFCHAADAEGAMRVGAPHALMFDVAPVCFDAACTPGDATLAAMHAGVAETRDRARRIYDLALAGRMPPGALGRRVSDPARVGLARRVPAGSTLDQGTPLPPIDSAEGQRILGNWLACGAPVVQTVRAPDATHLPGDACAMGASDLGDCVTRVVAPHFAPVPARTWTFTEVYEHVLEPLCARSCHGADAPRTGEPTFGPDAATTYATLLEANGADTLVFPGPGNHLRSHLYHHLAGTAGYRRMPTHLVTARLPSEVVAAIAQWIEAGAPP